MNSFGCKSHRLCCQCDLSSQSLFDEVFQLLPKLEKVRAPKDALERNQPTGERRNLFSISAS